MKKKNMVIIVVFTAGIIVLGIYNIITNPDFFKGNIISCITLLIAIFISYLLVQRNADERNRKEAYRGIILATIKIVDDRSARVISISTDPKELTMRTRQLNNYMGVLEKYGKSFGLEEDIRFIKEHVDEYNNIIGNHIDDLEHLEKSEQDLGRPLELVTGRLYEMLVHLYS